MGAFALLHRARVLTSPITTAIAGGVVPEAIQTAQMLFDHPGLPRDRLLGDDDYIE